MFPDVPKFDTMYKYCSKDNAYLLLIIHSGVVGSFLLWERSHGIMVTYVVPYRYQGEGVVPE